MLLNRPSWLRKKELELIPNFAINTEFSSTKLLHKHSLQKVLRITGWISRFIGSSRNKVKLEDEFYAEEIYCMHLAFKLRIKRSQ